MFFFESFLKNEEHELKKAKLEPDFQIPMNCLFGLPVELKVLIFKNLDFKDLSIQSTVCKTFRDIIISHFLLSREHLEATFKRISKHDNTGDYLTMCNDLGLLIKRATFVLPNYQRTKLVIRMFQVIDLKNRLKLIFENDKQAFKNFTKAIKCVISRLISGWVFKEVLKLYNEMELYFDNSNLLVQILTKEFGFFRQHEQYIRFFYRKVSI